VPGGIAYPLDIGVRRDGSCRVAAPLAFLAGGRLLNAVLAARRNAGLERVNAYVPSVSRIAVPATLRAWRESEALPRDESKARSDRRSDWEQALAPTTFEKERELALPLAS
jgi:hypothetical protein